jgi:hypothetical protein
MRLADTLKVLLKSSVLTKIAIASQGENNITKASVTILSGNDGGNLLHGGQVLGSSIISFD